jgi:hypothetical protein
MHAVDYLNCAKGIPGANGGSPYCPALAELGETGINYRNASTSKPSDSFPGLTAIVSGGSPRTFGVYYDVAYDRVLAPPQTTTGNGVAGGACTPGQPNGTTTEYEEGIDINQALLNGGAPGASPTDGGIASIDPARLIRNPYNSCQPVYPWNFVRTNTIFGVIHQNGGYTAWSDKHPAYSSVSGPGDGKNINDFYGPEINSDVTLLANQKAVANVTTPLGESCASLDLSSGVSAWTDSFFDIRCYDTLKVNAILNEIKGRNHLGTAKTKVPNIFGMNFQAVSVGQKLIENGGKGGYSEVTPPPRRSHCRTRRNFVAPVNAEHRIITHILRIDFCGPRESRALVAAAEERAQISGQHRRLVTRFKFDSFRVTRLGQCNLLLRSLLQSRLPRTNFVLLDRPRLFIGADDQNRIGAKPPQAGPRCNRLVCCIEEAFSADGQVVRFAILAGHRHETAAHRQKHIRFAIHSPLKHSGLAWANCSLCGAQY